MNSLIVADFKNIELRVLAFLAKDPILMEQIINGDDVYSTFASKFYKRQITEVDKIERQVGKAAVLGLGYGMGPNKFQKILLLKTGQEFPLPQVKDLIALYRDVYQGVPKFWKHCDSVIEDLISPPYSHFPGHNFLGIEKEAIILPSGLKIKFPNLRKIKTGRWEEWVYDRFKSKVTEPDPVKIYGGMLTENLCQGLAGEICKVAIKRLIEAGYPPSGQVHDEVLVVVLEKVLADAVEAVKKAMTAPMPWWPELPLGAEIGVGKNWLEAK